MIVQNAQTCSFSCIAYTDWISNVSACASVRGGTVAVGLHHPSGNIKWLAAFLFLCFFSLKDVSHNFIRTMLVRLFDAIFSPLLWICIYFRILLVRFQWNFHSIFEYVACNSNEHLQLQHITLFVFSWIFSSSLLRLSAIAICSFPVSFV